MKYGNEDKLIALENIIAIFEAIKTVELERQAGLDGDKEVIAQLQAVLEMVVNEHAVTDDGKGTILTLKIGSDGVYDSFVEFRLYVKEASALDRTSS